MAAASLEWSRQPATPTGYGPTAYQCVRAGAEFIWGFLENVQASLVELIDEEEGKMESRLATTSPLSSRSVPDIVDEKEGTKRKISFDGGRIISLEDNAGLGSEDVLNKALALESNFTRSASDFDEDFNSGGLVDDAAARVVPGAVLPSRGIAAFQVTPDGLSARAASVGDPCYKLEVFLDSDGGSRRGITRLATGPVPSSFILHPRSHREQRGY